MSTFAERFDELMRDRNARVVADALGTDPSSLSYYRAGKRRPSLEVLIKIAGYFSVSTDWLVGLSDQRRPVGRNELDRVRDEAAEWVTDRAVEILTEHFEHALQDLPRSLQRRAWRRFGEHRTTKKVRAGDDDEEVG